MWTKMIMWKQNNVACEVDICRRHWLFSKMNVQYISTWEFYIFTWELHYVHVIGFVTCGSEFPPTVRQSVIWLYYVSSQILMCLSLEMTPLSTPSKYIIFFFFFKSIYLRFYYELKSNIQNLKLLWHHSSEETSICVSLTTQVAAVNSCCSFTFKRDCPDVSELISSWPFIPQKQ